VNDPNKDLFDSIIADADPEALKAVADAGTKYLRTRLREGEIRNILRALTLRPELAPALDIARAFAIALFEDLGEETIRKIDELNFTAQTGVCHSHDDCDANMYMRSAMIDVVNIDAAEVATDSLAGALWEYAWKLAKHIGFARLALPRGEPDSPPDSPAILLKIPDRSMVVTLPGMYVAESHPMEVRLDYWGRNPHAQFLCYDHDDEQGEPKVVVRYNQQGKVVEVLVGNVTLIKGHDGEFAVRPHADTSDTPWEIERDANPPCAAGDRLKMPSGQVAKVMRLRDRYDNDIEQFRAYNEAYGVLERLDGYPGSHPRHQVYTDVEQAWEVNPLTAGTSNPEDFSFVPQQPMILKYGTVTE
jgi:hypothetical protein